MTWSITTVTHLYIDMTYDYSDFEKWEDLDGHIETITKDDLNFRFECSGIAEII